MLILLLLFFVIVAIVIPFFYRAREGVSISSLLLSLVLMVGVVLVYMAKKGGIEDEFLSFFFLTRRGRDWLRFLPLTLHQLGFLLAIGRCLFPYCLLKVAVSYSLSPRARRLMPKFKWIFLINIITLFLSSPFFYRYLVNSPMVMEVVISLVNIVLLMMTLLALVIVYKEFFSIELAVFRRQFFLFTLLLTSITGLYLLYFVQEPGQIYYFYLSNYVWQQGVFYLRALLPIRLYYILVLATVVVTILGAAGLVRYIQGVVLVSRQEVAIKKKTQLMTPTTSMFIHGIKNQMLSQQILVKRLKKTWSEGAEEEKMERYLTALETDMAESVEKINRFYKSLRVNTSYLLPVSAQQIIQKAVAIFHQQSPQQLVEIKGPMETILLADEELLSEALSNLLTNAYEAIVQAGRLETGKIQLRLRNVRAFTVIEVVDNGCGISKKLYSKLFEPFYSQKNSATNWGMGLYFVRGIIKDHYGGIYCESQVGVGTTFTVYLPKYEAGEK